MSTEPTRNKTLACVTDLNQLVRENIPAKEAVKQLRNRGYSYELIRHAAFTAEVCVDEQNNPD